MAACELGENVGKDEDRKVNPEHPRAIQENLALNLRTGEIRILVYDVSSLFAYSGVSDSTTFFWPEEA